MPATQRLDGKVYQQKLLRSSLEQAEEWMVREKGGVKSTYTLTLISRPRTCVSEAFKRQAA